MRLESNPTDCNKTDRPVSGSVNAWSRAPAVGAALAALGAGVSYACVGRWGIAAFNLSAGLAVVSFVAVWAAMSEDMRLFLAKLWRGASHAGRRFFAVWDPPPTARVRYDNFDGLRLILAALVVWLHAGFRHSVWHVGLFAPVPIFMGLSGFVVLQSIEHCPDWWSFAVKRLRRVGPAFVAALLLGAVVMGPGEIYGTIRCWLTGGLDNAPNAPTNGVVWSLGWEELAYAIMAVLFFGLRAYRRRGLIWLIFAIDAAWVASMMPHFPHDNILAVMPCFWIGNLMYLYRVEMAALSKWLPMAVLGSVLACYGTARGTEHEIARQFVCELVLVVSVLWACAFGPRFLPRPKYELSYGLYLYHSLPAVWLEGLGYDPAPVVFFLVVLALGLLMAWISWMGIERWFAPRGNSGQTFIRAADAHHCSPAIKSSTTSHGAVRKS
jgi:peptidoglycan/LPS O-acetylase OafA/YrhL